MSVSEPDGAADGTPRSSLTRRLNLIGLTITGVWLLFMFSYALAVRDNLLAMKPNEFGDLLAGTFAPLAFLWLVLGFFQQGEELRHSSRALWLQGEELRNSVEQQRQLVEATREQLQLEREVLSYERAELARTSGPIFKIDPGGSVPMGDRGRRYDFRLLNHGKACTAVKLHFDNAPGQASWVSIQGGHAEPFSVTLPPGDDREFVAIVEYLDTRALPGTQRLKIKKHGSRFEISEAEVNQ